MAIGGMDASRETAVAREVCSLIKKEVEHLFSALPSHDVISWR
jgi:hypothetical protein